MLLNENTTPDDLDAVFDEMNNPNLISNNIKRSVREIFGNNFLESLFIRGSFQAKREINALLEQFENTQNIEEGEQILRKIYTIAVKRLYQVENNKPKADRAHTRLKDALGNIANQLGIVINLDAKDDSLAGRGRMVAQEKANARRAYSEALGVENLGTISRHQIESGGAYGFRLPKNPTQAEMQQKFDLMK